MSQSYLYLHGWGVYCSPEMMTDITASSSGAHTCEPPVRVGSCARMGRFLMCGQHQHHPVCSYRSCSGSNDFIVMLSSFMWRKTPWVSLWQGSVLPPAAAGSCLRACCLALQPADLLLWGRICWYWKHKDLIVPAPACSAFETISTFPDAQYRKGLLSCGGLLGFCQMSLCLISVDGQLSEVHWEGLSDVFSHFPVLCFFDSCSSGDRF